VQHLAAAADDDPDQPQVHIADRRHLPARDDQADDALSATVSTSLIFQSATRLSTISIAGSTPAIAASAVPVVTPGPRGRGP
jgi:hypothetical protein